MMFVLIIVAVVVVMYARTLNYGYCIDEFDVAKRSVGQPISKSFWRRAYLSWQGIQYNNPFLAHVLTFTIHLANSVMVYYAFGQNWISFLTALLFAIHPAGTQGSVWCSGKGYSTAAFFTLLMFAIPVVSPAAYWMAFTFGGFSATFIPGVFLTTPNWFLTALIPLMVILKRNRIKTALSAKWKITPKATKEFNPKKIILYFKTLGYYSWLAVFPMKLGVYHKYLYTYGLSEEETKQWHKPDPYMFLGLGVMSALFANLIVYPKEPVTLGLLWFVLLISQWCNCPTTLQQAIAERYFYLPMIGAMFALVNAIYLIPYHNIRGILLTAFIVGFAVRVHVHIPSYRNIHYQIEHNLLNFPDCYAIWTWKGQEEKNRGAFFTALEAWFEGWKLRKIDFRLNNNIAVLLTQVGQLDQALDFLKIAEQNIPKDQMESGMEYINAARNQIIGIKRQQELDARKIKSRIIIP